MIQIPKPDPKKLKILKNFVEDGIDSGMRFDLVGISKICGRVVNEDELSNIDEDVVDDSIIESLFYGRPEKFDKITKRDFELLFEGILESQYTDAQQQWIIEMLEIMYSLPSGFISEKIYYDNMSIDNLWDNVQSYKPIVL
jgi:hypothetical protein